jgi:hypothetical protein
VRAARLTRPYSRFVLDLVADTIAGYQAIRQGDDWQQEVARRIQPQPRYLSDQIDRTQLALMFLGIRMHILADTWAHQDFTGDNDDHINGAGFFNNVYADFDGDAFTQVTFTNTVGVWQSDNDCAAAPAIEGAYRGHGQMGHFPDYGWLRFLYPAAWGPANSLRLRDNPTAYQEAWCEIAQVIHCCLDQAAPVAMPEDVRAAITQRFPLSSTTLSAVPACEANWAAGPGRDLPAGRWGGSAPSRALGIKAGLTGQLLPLTREGDLWVINGSTLHLFELASTMHYQWCVGWTARNPAFGWTATTPGVQAQAAVG